MVTITSPSKVAATIAATTPISLDEITQSQLFNMTGDARSTDFSKAFIKTNAQVWLNCSSSQKWYMRYQFSNNPNNEILFLAITSKNKVSKGKIVMPSSSRDNSSEEAIIFETETITQ